MVSTRKARVFRHDRGLSMLSVLGLWLLFCLPLSRAQVSTDSAATTIATASGILTTTSPIISMPSMTTLFSSIRSSNSTSSPMSTSTSDGWDYGDDNSNDDNDDEDHPLKGVVFNYYFLFLALLAVLIAAGLWWLRLNKNRKKQQMRLSGQNALARDLEGWPSARRFLHGRLGRNQNPIQSRTQTRREEGLDENGEAPPPYQPKTEVAVSHEPVAEGEHTSTIAIPLRTLQRNSNEQMRPPVYTSADSAEGDAQNRPLPPP